MATGFEALVGSREQSDDVCALPLVRRVSALLDRDVAALRDGDSLPRGWHFLLFTPTTPQHDLGRDGTPAGQGLFTTPAGMRRMMGGRRATFLSDIPIGSEVRRVSEVISVTPKEGRSGRLHVVSTRVRMFVAGAAEPAVQEDYDTIFREAAAPGAPAAEPAPLQKSRSAAARKQVLVDETMLFRYSAITFNAHRIHVDHPYTTGVEGYPALVVNGGLTGLLLLEFGRGLTKAPLKSTTSRNVRPLFCGGTIALCAHPHAGGVSLWAEDEQGHVCVEIEVAA